MTEYEKWQKREAFSYSPTDAHLPEDVQVMLNEIPKAFKRAAEDAGVLVLPDMEGPVRLWEIDGLDPGIPLMAVSRRLNTPDTIDDFYAQFLEEFKYAKQNGLLAVAYYYASVMKSGGRYKVDPKTFEQIDTGVDTPFTHSFYVRYAGPSLK
ncbi:hypothetical protein RsoM2USA_229 [Ralstonia phage RsoM2USA]|nr:hypothetical protein RsoM2USA_229 [Ralstonia phage RsoM2USA]